MLNRSWLAVVLLVLALSPIAWAADASARIASYLSARHKFNGVVLVAQNGRVLHNQAYGFANRNPIVALRTDSVFNLASVSKPFTAMAIMLLEEQDELEYSDDVSKFIPGFPYRGVTVRHLLQHTGGLPDYFALAEEHWDTRKDLTNQDIVGLLKRYKPARLFKPGAKYDYSNTGYALLASIVESASGQTFAVFLRDNIFKPLDMKSTFVYSRAAIKPFQSRRAYGWARDDKKYESDDMTWLDGVVGDGGVYSCTADLFRWDQALYGEDLVSAATLKKAFTPGRTADGESTDYGFGWNISDGMIGHDGSWAGFRTSLNRMVKTRDTIIMLNNTGDEKLDAIDERIREILSD